MWSTWSTWLALAMLAMVAAQDVVFRSLGTYSVETTLVLNSGAGRRRAVGYRLAGVLAVSPVWQQGEDQLLQFTLESMQLQLVGAHERDEWRAHGSLWDDRPAADVFYARRAAGRPLTAYLDPGDPTDVLNYKRALLSLFQFQVPDADGEGHNETDVSGECWVSYETLSPTVFRKIKQRCAFESVGDEWGPRARRVTRYTLNAPRDALAAVHAEELVWLTAAPGEGQGEEQVGVKARSWTTLTLLSDVTPATPHADLDAALAALPQALTPTPLPLPLPDLSSNLDDEGLVAAVEAGRAALSGGQAGGAGTRAAAAALWPLLRALRAASPAALHALLQRAAAEDGDEDTLSGLCRALGLAGTRAAWHAARALLQPAAADALSEHVHHYLAGLALSDEPHDDVVEEVLALGADARVPGVGESALLAGAAAARRGSPALRAAARDRLSRGLARCRDALCRAVRLRALGNLRDAATTDLLVAAAERGEPDAAGAAALAALRLLPAEALTEARLERVGAVAGNASRTFAERALALDLVTEARCAEHREAVPVQLALLARTLAAESGAVAHELRRALWQRLETLAARPATVALMRALPPAVKSWDARAAAGTTSVLRRNTGWSGAWAGAGSLLDSLQLAERGMLHRGAVTLLTEEEEDLLAVEVETQGLASLVGDGDGDPGARLQLAVGGAALRPVTLFDGQAELLGHIWAGRGAAPTAVLRALVPGGRWAGAAPLAAGAVLTSEAHSASALALDAHATVSLWYRTARARLSLRAAVAGAAHAAVRTQWSELSARAEGGQDAARLRIAADLDFYEDMTLCVRAHLDDHADGSSVRLQSVGGARALRVLRDTKRSVARAGRTLALGRVNDAACRVLRSNDPEEDDPAA